MQQLQKSIPKQRFLQEQSLCQIPMFSQQLPFLQRLSCMVCQRNPNNKEQESPKKYYQQMQQIFESIVRLQQFEEIDFKAMILWNQCQWLHEKKKSLLQEMLNLQAKALSVSDKSHKHFQQLQHEKQQFSERLSADRKDSEEQIAKLQSCISQLEDIVAKRVSELEVQRQKNDEVGGSYQEERKLRRNAENQLQEFINKCARLQNLHQDFKETSERKNQESFDNQKNEVDSIIAKYETLIENRVFELQTNYEKEIESMRLHNRQLLQKIQQESERKSTKNDEQSKTISKDYSRIIDENRKLLSSINEYKQKQIDLQNTVGNLTQQLKISAKEKQYSIENFKRQLQMIKQDNGDLHTKNKKLISNIDEATWALRQSSLLHSQEIKRIQKETEKQLNQCLQTGVRSISKLETEKGLLVEGIRKIQVENLEKVKEIGLLTDQLERERRKLAIKEEEESDNRELIKLAKEHKMQMIKKDSQTEALQQQIKRLKAKVNKVTTAYHDHFKTREILQKQNKMLLSEIVFLRDRQKKKPEWSRVLEDVKSDVSREQGVAQEQLQSYKQIVIEMENGMQSALEKNIAKDRTIDRQKNIISRLEKALQLK